MEWTTACPDWETRLIERRSIIPPPIFRDPAEHALAIFKQLKVVDLPKVWDAEIEEWRPPTFGECSEEWVFDFVRAIFGGCDPETGKQLIREYGLLISKKNTKSTIAAGIMLTALILCWREEEEHLILAPTKEVADNSFKPAAGMIRTDEELSALFHIQDHIRTITHRVNRNSLKVVAADTDTVSGKKSGRILVDELWLFGKRANAAAMFLEALGGQVSRDEGWVIFLTTQSDDPPAGVFRQKLNYWRDVRDGKINDPKTLGILYEFPAAMVMAKAYMRPENFYITNPNLGRSVSAEWLQDQLRLYEGERDGTFQKFLAKHLNIEIGINLRTDRWAGADFWISAGLPERVELFDLLEQCEVIAAGIDGGGLDDLLGLGAVGRMCGSRNWLAWAHAWAHPSVLERRKEIAPALHDFEKAGDLTIVSRIGDDVVQAAEYVARIERAGLLYKAGVDPAGIGAVLDALAAAKVPEDKVIGISQGWKLSGAIKTTERRIAAASGQRIDGDESPDGALYHGGQPLLTWAVGNARVVPVGNAVNITKQVSGTAKIDPLMALFNAVSLMGLNPPAQGQSVYETRGIRFL
ncbi:terminase large subunit [Burkholderia pseudomallei]|uniref:Phage terminase, large subunit, putative n=1 Tax=Burkholderia thailandensis (strain ATCC 700388 / DSM 13276 / CCUG 48851 / CIP 106301 / E264) TaxID=271848 RepID=Q2T6F8_BURTA|nr:MULTISPECIES: terminase large subunit [pseudomallei group]UYE89903.1 terminase DNA packaging protein A [Burkholderia phage PhiBt-E264.1]ABC35656.1 phage terminase, large subunit, putative [Burkholderia thailandensis E264]AHI75636.1 phage Terminase family protein [Burkholderia thailandensis 2002721723]AIP28250.1 phage Terminase family protein [Burkholderia thailandensis E264]AJY02632.1 phage Terminase family protein [Burkholderia thailandensis 2002721643]